METAKMEQATIPKIRKIKLNEYHSYEYLKNIKATFKDKVVFILPNGKEIKIDEK